MASSTFLQSSRNTLLLRSTPNVSKRLLALNKLQGGCLSRFILMSRTWLTKLAGFALATSALIASRGFQRDLPSDEFQSKTYMHGSKGTGTANRCPTLADGLDSFAFKPGKYQAKKFCLEPTKFNVKAEGVSKNSPPDFQDTKLMTRLTYTLDKMELSSSRTRTGLTTPLLPFSCQGGACSLLVHCQASGKPESFSGEFLVPSYRGSSFLDPKGRGGSTGYDNAVALLAGGRGDEEELQKENIKNTASSTGKITEP